MNIQKARKGRYMQKTAGGTRRSGSSSKGKTTGTTYGFGGSGIGNKAALSDASKSIKGKSETERLRSQLDGAQALQRRTMAQLGAGDINKSEAKEQMANAMDRIRESAEGLASMDPGNTIKGLTLSDGRPILSSAGKTVFDQVMRNVTGGVGSNFDNMSRGLLRPGQNIGGREYPQGFSPYQGKDMRMGLMEFAPITQNFQKLMRRGAFLPFFMKDRLNKRADERIVDTPRTLADLGMTPDQNAQINIIETENTPLVNPQDMNLQNAVNPSFASPQDMGFLDDENIFDTEKAAIDAALTPGDIVYNPADDDFRGKVNFINQALDGANYPYESPNDPAYRPMIEQLFEKVKRNIGTKEIRPTVDAGNAQEGDGEDPIPGGQFDLTNPAFSDQTNLVLSGDPDYDFSNFNTNAELGSLSQDPNSFPEGGVSGKFVDNMGSGTEMVGDKIFPSEGGSQEALDILNSNATDGVDFSGYPTMGFDDGGYARMSTFQKLKMMADSIG